MFSGLMACAALQIITEAVTRLVQNDQSNVTISNLAICLLAGAIGLKILLLLMCKAIGKITGNAFVDTLSLDHFNDVAVNSITSTCGIISGYFPQYWFIDSMGAVVLGCLILRSWVKNGGEQISLLIGRSAEPEFLNKLSYIAAHHHPAIIHVDTVRAFHFGVRFLVEVDIVLPPNMPLHEAHDIGDSLETRIEKMEEVERAYVHLDWEFTHKPERVAGLGNRHDIPETDDSN